MSFKWPTFIKFCSIDADPPKKKKKKKQRRSNVALFHPQILFLRMLIPSIFFLISRNPKESKGGRSLLPGYHFWNWALIEFGHTFASTFDFWARFLPFFFFFFFSFSFFFFVFCFCFFFNPAAFDQFSSKQYNRALFTSPTNFTF